MKILTVLGTRPEIIRLGPLIELLDKAADHYIVHTGQNYDDRLDGLFFRELGVRAPDIHLGVRGAGFGDQVGQMLSRIEPILREQRPDRVLVLGDTNSGLVALVARQLGIPVYHMEAGNRCFDDRVPEEINRRVIDHASSILLPYTERSRHNLLAEGIPSSRVFVTGNPIKQVIDRYATQIAESSALAAHGLVASGFFLATMHRSENVDREDRLRNIVDALTRLAAEHEMPVLCSVHPRTRARAEKFGVDIGGRGRVKFVEPLGFFDFVHLEQRAFCVLSDSGTVQEEACLFGVPTVTIRDVTERPETVECGSNYLAGNDPDAIGRGVRHVTAGRFAWTPPVEYTRSNVAEVVCRILTSYRVPDTAEIEWRSGART